MANLKKPAAVLVLVAALGLVLGKISAPAIADDYPSRPIKIIAPFGPGGPTDVYTRAIAEELRKSLHQTVFIENRPGAGTTIGTDLVAKAAPDGYMLLMISGTQCVNETLYSKKPYQLMRDLVPVAPLVDTDLVLVVTPSLPVKNVAELLALARAKPGTLNYGSSGPGSNYHMAGELLKNHDWHRHCSCALQGIERRPHRHPWRTNTTAVRFSSHHGADHQGRRRSGHRHHRQDALRDPAATCRHSTKPASKAFRRAFGWVSWRRQERRNRSSICSTVRSPKSCRGRI